MRLIIARHGETHENVKKVFQGLNNGTLSRNGRQQIKKLANRLKDEQFDIILSSDLKRTIETTKAILKYHKKVPVIYMKLLRERNIGILEGKKIDDHPEFYYKTSGPSARPPKGESFADVRKRAIKLWKTVSKKYHGKSVLVVTHTIFIRQLLGYLLHKSVMGSFEISQGNTAVNIIEVDEDRRHRVHLIGCVKHL